MTAARPPDGQKCEGLGVVPQADAGNKTADDPQYAQQAAAEQARKAWATAQARCTLAGFRADLIEADDGRPMLVVSRWALTRSFSTPDEADAWLHRVGAPA